MAKGHTQGQHDSAFRTEKGFHKDMLSVSELKSSMAILHMELRKQLRLPTRDLTGRVCLSTPGGTINSVASDLDHGQK